MWEYIKKNYIDEFWVGDLKTQCDIIKYPPYKQKRKNHISKCTTDFKTQANRVFSMYF
jgi:hypothetical protein